MTVTTGEGEIAEPVIEPVARPRWYIVIVHGLTRERHLLPSGLDEAEETLCGLPRPGRWEGQGFTSRPRTVGCEACSQAAEADAR